MTLPSFDLNLSTSLHRTSAYDFSFLKPLKPTVVFNTYWYLATARQEVFFKRLRRCPPPWTDDPIIAKHKFTNAYRASDRVSQYLIRNVIYKGSQEPNEVFFRILLFKIFNRIETWELLSAELGPIAFHSFSYSLYDAILSAALAQGERIYSPAYIMPSGGPHANHSRKHRMHLALLERMIAEDLPRRLVSASSMRETFELLKVYPSIGNFLAYQYATDVNYSTLTNFDEMDFVVPGPGARRGLQKCFSSLGGLTEAEAIQKVTSHQQDCFSTLGLEFKSLWGRPLQLIDCQNLFCEVDKYARVRHPEFTTVGNRTRIKQTFQASRTPIDYWYPPKWGLNQFLG